MKPSPLMRRLWSEDAVTHTGPVLQHARTHPLSQAQATAPAGVVRWALSGCLQAHSASGRRFPGLLPASRGSRQGRCVPFARLPRSTSGLSQRTITGPIVPFHFGDEDISAEIAALVKRTESTCPLRRPTPPGARLTLSCAVSTPLCEVGITKFVMRPHGLRADHQRSVRPPG